MPKIMKSLNIISRCQAAWRTEKVRALPSCHHVFVFAICKNPGKSQEELARDICLNKSTVARALSSLEEKGYITREPNPVDKRELLIYPTDKMTAILPEIRSAAAEWNELILEDISAEELKLFESVIARMEKSAKSAADAIEGVKE